MHEVIDWIKCWVSNMTSQINGSKAIVNMGINNKRETKETYIFINQKRILSHKNIVQINCLLMLPNE